MARPNIANAAARTATAWWVQGFAREEDLSIQKIVADYQKVSGDTISLVTGNLVRHRRAGLRQLGWPHRVDLGQHDLVRQPGVVAQLHDRAVGGGDAAAGWMQRSEASGTVAAKLTGGSIPLLEQH